MTTGRGPRDERGQTTVLIIGLAVVLLMAAVVAIDASAAFLRRQELDTVADGAALAGADAGSRDLDALYGRGVADTDRLDQAQVVARRAVADYLRAIGARAAYPGLSYTVSFDAARDAVTVRIDAPLDLPLTIPGSPHRPVVGAEGTAVVQVEQ